MAGSWVAQGDAGAMKVLWVKANKIVPVHSGGDLRSFNIVRHLATTEEVVFFSYYDGPTDEEYERKLRQPLPGAVCVSTGRMRNTALTRVLDYMWRLQDAAP